MRNEAWDEARGMRQGAPAPSPKRGMGHEAWGTTAWGMGHGVAA